MKRMGFAFVLAVVVGGGLMVACGGEDFDSCEANNTCGGGSGGTDGGTGGSGGSGGTSGTGGTGNTGGTGGQGGATGGTGGDGGTCDTSKSPSEEACLISDENAVFVSPTGASTGAGTKASPLKSFADAVAKAKTAGHGRVIACNGDYDEKLTLTSSADGIKVYGGFKCSDWSYDASAKANLKPTTTGIVLTLDTLAGGATFEDVGFIAMAGSAPGESSIAGFAKESGAISMKRVRLEAGKGVKGAAGTKTDVAYPTATDLKGNDASGDTGGGGKQCSCLASADKTVGGKGGDGGAINVSGGGPGQPALGGGLGGQAGAPCAGAGTGGDGAPAPAVNPSPGATSVGSVSASGWAGTPGGDGVPGGPGQGGGGGTGIVTGGGGGGGGCGACGGAPGKGGGAGGSSVALLALNTAVTIDTSDMVVADAGDGGSGAAGQTGQQVGGGGGNKSGLACGGGNGGKGADGGAGGGGAGGVSAGVVWKGKAPTLNTTTPTLGNKGAKGVGGKAGTNDGIDGDAKATLEVQ